MGHRKEWKERITKRSKETSGVDVIFNMDIPIVMRVSW
jgi:hypothetical protein